MKGLDLKQIVVSLFQIHKRLNANISPIKTQSLKLTFFYVSNW